jgi:hypothetical protein
MIFLKDAFFSVAFVFLATAVFMGVYAAGCMFYQCIKSIAGLK